MSGLLLYLLLSFTVKFLFWETVGNLSVDCRWPVGSVSVTCRPTVDRQSVSGSCSSQLPNLLAVFDLKGKPYQNTTYHSNPRQVERECTTDKFINSITISVKDENGGLFDFKGFPLVFELELI